MSMATAVKPVTFRSTPYSSSSSGRASSRSVAHELGGRRVVGSGLGHDLDDAGVGGLVRRRECDLLDAGDLLDLVGQVVHQAERIGRGDDRAGHDERAVEARTEVLGGQVVRLARLARLGLLPGVRQGEAEARGGDRDDAERQHDRDGGDDRMVGDQLHPPVRLLDGRVSRVVSRSECCDRVLFARLRSLGGRSRAPLGVLRLGSAQRIRGSASPRSLSELARRNALGLRERRGAASHGASCHGPSRRRGPSRSRGGRASA